MFEIGYALTFISLVLVVLFGEELLDEKEEIIIGYDG